MTMTTREAFERGTDDFNAHDIDGFATVVADDVVFTAPGGMRGEGKPATHEGTSYRFARTAERPDPYCCATASMLIRASRPARRTDTTRREPMPMCPACQVATNKPTDLGADQPCL